MKRREFESLAGRRPQEARILLDAGQWSDAYYLGGYAVEFLLKACIAKQFVSEDIPDWQAVKSIFVHDLTKLLNLAKLKPDLEMRKKVSYKFSANWELVERWNEQARYRSIDEIDAKYMLEAVCDPDDGVYEWIRSRL